MALAAVIVALACLTLVACGSSSSTGSSTASSSATASSTTGTNPGATNGNRAAFAGRFKAVRECLQKDGITLPKPTPGQGGGGRGPFAGAGRALPAGVSKSSYEAALRKCGAPAAGRGGRANSTAFKRAVTKFAACMHENGVKVPTPNTSGTGPVFNTTGLNTSSAQFKAAQAKCASLLRGSLPTNPAG
jgi:hypothetical protein